MALINLFRQLKIILVVVRWAVRNVPCGGGEKVILQAPYIHIIDWNEFNQYKLKRINPALFGSALFLFD